MADERLHRGDPQTLDRLRWRITCEARWAERCQREGWVWNPTKHRIPPLPSAYFAPKRRGVCRWCGQPIMRDGIILSRCLWCADCSQEYNSYTAAAANLRSYVVLMSGSKNCAACGGFGDNIDHVRPLRDSNGRIEFWFVANLQLLCLDCHRDKTTAEGRARRLAAVPTP